MEPLSPPPSLPAWVHKRDGRVVPFEPDRISRALFAATESLSRPNAFLARELTDAVLHFLPSELDGPTLTTANLAELVAKVVRELGQPALAQAFLDHRRLAAPVRAPSSNTLAIAVDASLSERLESCTRDYALGSIYARDLQAGHREELLTLTGLSHPLELAASVLPPAPPGALVEAIEDARRYTGGLLALDGPEYLLAQTGCHDVGAFVRELGIGLRATGLRAVLNLNSMAPSWADDLADGPLFTGLRQPLEPDRLSALADELTERVLAAASPVRVDWHLAERDFSAAAAPRLLSLVRRALDGAPLAFAFDRPRRPPALAEGMDRRNPAVLLTVGLNLKRLIAEMGPAADSERFVQKLGSLARLALSAGTQNREFLRRHSPGSVQLARGFLLGRARLLVAPTGLPEVVRELTGRELREGGAALDLARLMVQRLRAVLEQDGRACQLAAGVDVSAEFTLDGQNNPERRAGRALRDAAAPAKVPLRTAGVLHAAAEQGTAALLLPEGPPPSAEQLVDWLRLAWQQTEVVRLRFLRCTAEPQQLTLGGSPS